MQTVLSIREKRARRKRLVFQKAFTILQCCGVFLSLSVNYFKNYRNNSLSIDRIFGLILFISSYGLWFCARVKLGSSFSIQPNASELITEGIYACFSHPIYLFSALSIAGYILLIGKPLYLSSMILLIPIQYYRASKEYELLVSVFGDEYIDYRNRVIFF